MVPSGPPTPMGGAQPGPGSILLRSNSGLMAGGGTQQPNNSIQSQLVSPRTQFNSNNLLANISNVSSLLNHSFQNGGGGSSVNSMNMQQRNMLVGGSLDVLCNPNSDQNQHFQNSNGNQSGLEMQQQFLQQQQQLRGGMGNTGNLNPVKMEHQTGHSEQNGAMQQLNALRGMGGVKLEPQPLQSLRGLGPVKMETQQSDASMYLQQQQQQQLMHLSRQNSQASAASQMNLLQQQQRVLQQQEQQQQQLILKSLPHQRAQFQQQTVQQHGLPVRLPQVKASVYEPGMCARRLTHYMYHQQHRSEDNNIEFWRKFVTEYFAPNAKKRWCVSLYGSGRQTTGVFPQDVWHCEICNRKPGRGFETTVEVLPRLNQIKYASGTLEELLYVDMPHEYQNTSGQIVLDYAKAIQESVFEQLRVVRDGQLRIVFNPDLKIASWEFCARRHEELIPRRVIIPQVGQLGAVVHKYQAAAQNTSSALSSPDLQNTCSSFVASARQLAKALEVPLVNDLGYTKRYVRCLQISEVVNSMKDLIDYSRETGTGPMESLINFPRRTSNSSGLSHQQSQQQEEQQPIPQNSNHNDPGSVCATSAQLAAVSNGISGANNSVNAPASSATSGITIAGLLHQNSMNSRQENNQMGAVQIPSASSSSSLPPSQPNPSSSPSNNATQLNTANSPSNMPSIQQRSTNQSHEADMRESQSSVQQILQGMMMSSQLNGNGLVNSAGINGANYLVGNSSLTNNNGFRGMGGMGSSVTSGIRVAMANNMMGMNGRVGMNHISQDQQEMGNRLLGGLGAVNFNNLQFDWKSSP